MIKTAQLLAPMQIFLCFLTDSISTVYNQSRKQRKLLAFCNMPAPSIANLIVRNVEVFKLD